VVVWLTDSGSKHRWEEKQQPPFFLCFFTFSFFVLDELSLLYPPKPPCFCFCLKFSFLYSPLLSPVFPCLCITVSLFFFFYFLPSLLPSFFFFIHLYFFSKSFSLLKYAVFYSLFVFTSLFFFLFFPHFFLHCFPLFINRRRRGSPYHVSSCHRIGWFGMSSVRHGSPLLSSVLLQGV